MLIGETGEQIGVVPTKRAIELAREREYDLVEVAPNSSPPVCRLLDYGKYRYEQGKKEKEARKGQKISLLREVRMRPRINEHDLQSKIKLVRRLLDEGDKVKVTMMFRGREIAHPERGKEIFREMLSQLKDVALVDQPMVTERNLVLVFSPLKQQPSKAPAPAPAPAPAEQKKVTKEVKSAEN